MEWWPVGQALAMPREDPYELAAASDEYFCPVCGIGLAQSDFESRRRTIIAHTAAPGRRPWLSSSSLQARRSRASLGDVKRPRTRAASACRLGAEGSR